MSVEIQRTQRYVYRLDNDRVIRSFMYVLRFCIYISMYLPQAVSHQRSIGAQSDLFWHTGAALEIQLEPAEATCSLVVLPSLLLTRCRDRCTGARPDLS